MLKLSEAIALGRMLIDRPTAGDVTKCAIGMAMLAHDANYSFPKHPEFKRFTAYEEFEAMYPWLKAGEDGRLKCPFCKSKFPGMNTIWHVFDTHVMANNAITIVKMKKITLNEMIDWIRSIEPAPAAREAEPVAEEVKEVVFAK